MLLPETLSEEVGAFPPTQINLANASRVRRSIGPWKMLIRQVLTRRSSLRRPASKHPSSILPLYSLSLSLSLSLSSCFSLALWLLSLASPIFSSRSASFTLRLRRRSWTESLGSRIFINWAGVSKRAKKWRSQGGSKNKSYMYISWAKTKKISRDLSRHPGESLAFLSLSISAGEEFALPHWRPRVVGWFPTGFASLTAVISHGSAGNVPPRQFPGTIVTSNHQQLKRPSTNQHLPNTFHSRSILTAVVYSPF